MTDTEFDDLVAELSKSDTFPQHDTPNKALIAGNVQTPESISVAAKLFALVKKMDKLEAGEAIAKVLSAVDPKQASSLWTSLLSGSDKMLRFIKKTDHSRHLVVVLRRIYGLTEQYNIMAMTDDEYAAEMAIDKKKWSGVQLAEHHAELLAKYPF